MVEAWRLVGMFHSFRGITRRTNSGPIAAGCVMSINDTITCQYCIQFGSLSHIYITTIMRAGEMILYFLLYLSSGDDQWFVNQNTRSVAWRPPLRQSISVEGIHFFFFNPSESAFKVIMYIHLLYQRLRSNIFRCSRRYHPFKFDDLPPRTFRLSGPCHQTCHRAASRSNSVPRLLTSGEWRKHMETARPKIIDHGFWLRDPGG